MKTTGKGNMHFASAKPSVSEVGTYEELKLNVAVKSYVICCVPCHVLQAPFTKQTAP